MDKTIKIVFTIFLVVILGCALLFLSPLMKPAFSAPAGNEVSDTGKIPVFFFYGEECPHCHNVMPFIQNLSDKYPEVDIQMRETWHNETNLAFSNLLNKNLGIENPGVPEVIIGNTTLIGDKDIPASLEGIIIEEIKKKELNNPSKSKNSAEIPSGNISIDAFFFYGDGCSHCENVKPLLADLLVKYPELHIEMREIYHNTTNLELFSAMNSRYGTGNTGIPVVFIGSYALIGDTAIKDHLEEDVLAERQRLAVCNITGEPGNTTVPSQPPCTPLLTPQLVILSAFIDSFNPCAFSILIFLLISITAAGNRRRILLAGASYVAALFFFHLLAGVGIFSFVVFTDFARFFSLLGAILAGAFGVITLIDVLRNNENYLLAVPESKKHKIEEYIQTASIPAAFVLGILAGIFGFSCTGGVYISVLALMSRDYTLANGLPLLVLYNLIFIMPLVLVILLVAFGIPSERVNSWRKENRRILRLIIGLTMIALSITIFSLWIR
jgi:cytochrome c biogenesis protein CcdA/thiol-disulfide isomerase/thioredoxin